MKIKKLLPLFLVGSFAFAMPIILVSCATDTSENSENKNNDQYQEETKTVDDVILKVGEKYVTDSLISAAGEFSVLQSTNYDSTTKVNKSIKDLQNAFFPEGKWLKHTSNSTAYPSLYIAKNFNSAEGFKTFISYSDNWSTYIYDSNKENGIANGDLNIEDLIYDNITNDLISGEIKISDNSGISYVDVSFIPKENVVWKNKKNNYRIWFRLYFQKLENGDSPLENYFTQDKKENDIVDNTSWKYSMYDAFGEDELIFGNNIDKNQINFYSMSIDEIKKLFAPSQNNWISSKNELWNAMVYTLKNYKDKNGLDKFFSLTQFYSDFGKFPNHYELPILENQDLNYENILSNNINSELSIVVLDKSETTNALESIMITLKITLKDGYVWKSTDFQYSLYFSLVQTKNDTNTN